MYKKYSVQKFALGCEIVARWVRHATGNSIWTSIRVEMMCNITYSMQLPLFKEEAEALRKLFGLQSITELFTIPETKAENLHE
ncbi:MAG: hypothetical protein Q8L07_06125 [Sediminibacterium sp.]|nr:hypothetical protein [Sediminibacterium sp.]